MKSYRFHTTIKTLAIILNTSVDMLIGFAHSMGFNWVDTMSEAFYWLDNGKMEFAFFERK